MPKPKGHIIYEGPSLIDGKPIVVVATQQSNNLKTGNMIQTYILRTDIDPIAANKSGQDYSICGNCEMRGEPTDDPNAMSAKKRACYVVLKRDPLAVWKGVEKGIYQRIKGHEDIADIAYGRMVRLGAYGDPSAVPVYIWESLISKAKGHTGYSHHAKMTAPLNEFRSDLYMYSADTEKEARNLWEKGIRTFRLVKSMKDIHPEKEILCPAHELAGRRTTCENCGLCGGSKVDAKNIANIVHGFGSKYFAA